MFPRRLSQHIFVVLVVCLLFTALPAAGVPDSGVPAAKDDDAIVRAIAWLHTQQLEDGGFGFRRPDGTATSDAKSTADVIYALGLAGESATGPSWIVNGKTPLEALAALAPAYVGVDAGQAGKVARAVVSAGGDPRDFGGMDLISIIDAAYDESTGRYHPSWLFRHTLAIEALIRSGEPVPPAAWAALESAQLADGGWFWAFDATVSDVDTTGRVLQLLAGLGRQACSGCYERGVRYLGKGQLAGGGWGINPAPDQNPPNANSTALAVAGLRASGRNPDGPSYVVNGMGAGDTLLSFQEASGAFVYIREPAQLESRLMATVDALVALTQPFTVIYGPTRNLLGACYPTFTRVPPLVRDASLSFLQEEKPCLVASSF